MCAKDGLPAVVLKPFSRIFFSVFVEGDYDADDIFCASWTVVIVTAASFVFLQFCILVVCVLCIYASRGRARKEQHDDCSSVVGGGSGSSSTVYRSAVGMGSSSRDRFSAASRSGRSSVSLPSHQPPPPLSIYGGGSQTPSEVAAYTAAHHRTAESSANTLKSLRTKLRD